jgi:hypothetical protein
MFCEMPFRSEMSVRLSFSAVDVSVPTEGLDALLGQLGLGLRVRLLSVRRDLVGRHAEQRPERG